MARQPGLQARVDDAATQLAAEFNGTFTAQAVELLTNKAFDTLKSARVTEFVPLLVYRGTRERLLSIARTGDRESANERVLQILADPGPETAQIAPVAEP